MSDTIDWVCPPALADEVRAIMLQLSRRWPNKLGYLLSRTEAAQQDLYAFARALRDVDARVLPMLAAEFLAGNEFPPGPFELRVEALRIQSRDYPQASPPPVPPPAVDNGRDDARVDKISRKLREELGSHVLAGRVWETLRAAAGNDPEAVQRVNTGRVRWSDVQLAIEVVRASQRPARPTTEVAS